MNVVLSLLYSLIELYIWVIVVAVIFSWLLAFNLLNVNSSAIQSIHRALRGLTEPVIQPIRRFMPNLGAVDISTLVLIILLIFAQRVIVELLNA